MSTGFDTVFCRGDGSYYLLVRLFQSMILITMGVSRLASLIIEKNILE